MVRVRLTETTLRRILLENIAMEFKEDLASRFGADEADRIYARISKAGGVDVGRLLKSIRSSDPDELDALDREIRDLTLPTNREVREMVKSHADANTVRKEVNIGEERLLVLFTLTHSAAVMASKMAGGSKLCTASDTTCAHFKERSGPGADVVLVSFLPMSTGLKSAALEAKSKTARRKALDTDFDRAIAIQATLNVRSLPPVFEGEAGWYDDLLFDDEQQLERVLEELYGLGSGEQVWSLLSDAEREKITNHLGGKARSPKLMERWIEQFPDHMVTKLPPEGHGIFLDDVGSDAKYWGFRGVTLPVKQLQFENVTFEDCKLVGAQASINFHKCRISNTRFEKLSGAATFFESEIDDCLFERIQSTGTFGFYRCNIRSSAIKDSDIDFFKARDCDLSDVIFDGNEMMGADMRNCDFNRTSFTLCNLSTAIVGHPTGKIEMSICDLTRVQFVGTRSSKGIIVAEECEGLESARSDGPIIVDGVKTNLLPV
jgi:uncharacterized protein YjbI with pentapeptide repeats